MIPRNLGSDGLHSTAWQELEAGAATISAFAELCRLALIAPPDTEVNANELEPEAIALLLTGGKRGVLDIRACKDDFDSVKRFLAVCVETEPDSHVLFLQREDPAQTVAFLDAFGQLCRYGLMIHHLGRDFSFSKSGYRLASQLQAAGKSSSVEELMNFAMPLDH